MFLHHIQLLAPVSTNDTNCCLNSLEKVLHLMVLRVRLARTIEHVHVKLFCVQRLGMASGILTSLVKKNSRKSTSRLGVMLGCCKGLDLLIAAVQVFVVKLYIHTEIG